MGRIGTANIDLNKLVTRLQELTGVTFPEGDNVEAVLLKAN
jgi:hypothetical protein